MAVLVAMILVDQVSIILIFVVAALLASAEAVVDSSSMAMIPSTVDGEDLERAVGRLGSTELAMGHAGWGHRSAVCSSRWRSLRRSGSTPASPVRRWSWG